MKKLILILLLLTIPTRADVIGGGAKPGACNRGDVITGTYSSKTPDCTGIHNSWHLTEEFNGVVYGPPPCTVTIESPVASTELPICPTNWQNTVSTVTCTCIGTCGTPPTLKFCRNKDLGNDTCDTANLLSSTESTTLACSTSGAVADTPNQSYFATNEVSPYINWITLLVTNTPVTTTRIIVTINYAQEFYTGQTAWRGSSRKIYKANAGGHNDPGSLLMETFAVNGSKAWLKLGNSEENGDQGFWVSSSDDEQFYFQEGPFEGLTSEVIRVGMFTGDGAFALDPPTGGFYFQYDSSVDGNWHCITRASSVSTDNSSSTAVKGYLSGFQGLKITKIGSTVTFYIDGTQVCQQTTHVPADVPGDVGVWIKTLTGAKRTLVIDSFEAIGSNSSWSR